MRAFKTKAFYRWMHEEGILDKNLNKAIHEIQSGLIDAKLGSGLVKKRISIGSKGKSSGARVILAYQEKEKIFFIYGFKKNEIENIQKQELKALKRLSVSLLSKTQAEIKKAINSGELSEVK